MRRKIILLSAIVLIGCYLNFIYFKPVTALPPDAELLAHMNRYESDYQVQAIVDRIQLDDKHAVVPIQFSESQRGLSFWQWHNGDWRLMQFTTKTFLRWQLDEKDPTTNYVVWHLADWQTAHVEIHAVRERGYQVSNGDEHHYYPCIQLTAPYMLKGSGAITFPEQWHEILISSINSGAYEGFFDYYTPETILFHAAYDDAFIHESGYTYVTGEVESTVSFFRIMDGRELER